MTKRIKIIKSGFYTSVQDRGRMGYENLGVPISGAMDTAAYDLANLLLNNPPDHAVLECTLQGPQIEFMQETFFVITGAISHSHLDNEKITDYVPVLAKKGQVLKMGSMTSGIRSYVAFDGGLDMEIILGSRSYYKGITKNSKIDNGLGIPLGKSFFGQHKGVHLKIKNDVISTVQELTVYKGPEYKLLSDLQQEKLINQAFTVSPLWDRMALQLEETIPNELDQIGTRPVITGTIQLTPSGKLILLMRDCQTTGGYPRILQLSKESLDKVAQMHQGDQLLFTVA